MKNFLLKSPHWLIFTILFAVPFVFTMALYIYWVIDMMSVVSDGAHDSNIANAYGGGMPEFMRERMRFLFLIYLPSIVGMFLTEMWMHSFANEANSILPEELKVNLKYFNILVFVPGIVTLFIIAAVYILFNSLDFDSPEIPDNIGLIVFIIILSVVGYFLMLFSIFYSFVFAAHAYKTAVLNKKVTFSDYVGEFFCLWFSFVGIWIMQPKINQIANGTLNMDSYDNTSSHLIE